MGDEGAIWETTKNKPQSRSPGAMNYHSIILYVTVAPL